MLNRLSMILFVAYIYIDKPIWIQIPLIIAFVVFGAFADHEQIKMDEKLKNYDQKIRYNKNYIVNVSERLEKLEDNINRKGE
jgi:hypothetical protein